jgi:hypothetical protein
MLYTNLLKQRMRVIWNVVFEGVHQSISIILSVRCVCACDVMVQWIWIWIWRS